MGIEPGMETGTRAGPRTGPIVDAHHHVWDLDKVSYPWLGPSRGPMYRTFEASELEPQVRAAGIDKAVVVQAMDSYEETEYMLETAASYDWIGGVVGWVPLDRPAEAGRQLERWLRNGLFKGVRHLINLADDPDWLIRPDVIEGLQVLASFDIPFDVVAEFPNHLKHVPYLSDNVPGLKMIIDHLGKPPVKDKGWEPWAGELARAAENPNVCAKISGLNTTLSPDWTYADIKPYIDGARAVFGAERMMFGSDWPVTALAGDYAQVWRETNRAIADYDAGEQADILGRTAVRVYRI